MRRWFNASRTVVARSLCRLHWVRLAQVPLAERTAALQVQAQAWQPFDDCARCLVLQGEWGCVIAWDRAVAERALLAAGLDAAHHPLIPETLMRPPQADGTSLLQGAEGFEAQHWQAGQLLASRWWPHLPSEADWIQFLRSLPGQHEPHALPQEPVPLAWLSRPWIQPLSSPEGDQQSRARERGLVWLGAAALSLGAGFVAAQLVQVERAVAEQEAANTALREQLEPVLKQRERAVLQAAAAEPWQAWLTAPLPVDLIQYLNDLLARRQVLVREFELRGQTLRLGLEAPAKLPRAELLKALQSGGWLGSLNELRGQPGRDLIWFEAQLLGPERPVQVTAAPDPLEAVATHTTPLAPAAAMARPEQARAAPQGPAAPSPPAVAASRPAPRKGALEDLPPASVFDAIK